VYGVCPRVIQNGLVIYGKYQKDLGRFQNVSEEWSIYERSEGSKGDEYEGKHGQRATWALLHRTHSPLSRFGGEGRSLDGLHFLLVSLEGERGANHPLYKEGTQRGRQRPTLPLARASPLLPLLPPGTTDTPPPHRAVLANTGRS
jgi:hypothetical protein